MYWIRWRVQDSRHSFWYVSSSRFMDNNLNLRIMWTPRIIAFSIWLFYFINFNFLILLYLPLLSYPFGCNRFVKDNLYWASRERALFRINFVFYLFCFISILHYFECNLISGFRWVYLHLKLIKSKLGNLINTSCQICVSIRLPQTHKYVSTN